MMIYEMQISGLLAIIQTMQYGYWLIIGVFVIAMTVIILVSMNKISSPRVSNTYITYVSDRVNIIRSWVNMSTRIGRENND